MSERVQRIRITFAREDAQKYITHLDIMRAWERVLKRAAVPVAYSEGFTARPRIALAAPLAVGVTSECEILELYTTQRVAPQELAADLSAQLPAGLTISDAAEVPIAWPSLQSMLRAVVYVVTVADGRSVAVWESAIEQLLAKSTIAWEHMRGDKLRQYDLRPLIHAIELIETVEGVVTLRLRLRSDETGSGRPEQVTRALGVETEPDRIHRVCLELDQPSVAKAAYRAAGRPADE
jgi:radical SAM-linked protein